jgi:hypothetical protein
MDRLKKESLLELCENMDLRLQVQSAHIECGSTARALALNAKLREEVDFLKLNLQSESITVGRALPPSPLVPLSLAPSEGERAGVRGSHRTTITRKTLP